MGNIYKNQSKLRIVLKTGDLTGVQTARIQYTKPNGATGFFPGTLDAANEQIYYDVQNTDELDIAGTWKFWANLTFNDGRVAYGDPDSYQIFEQGEKL